MRPTLQNIIVELKATLHHLYGARLSQLVLFGSQARGDAVPESDIDVLVVLKGPVNPFQESKRLIDDTVRWNLEYQTLVSCVFVDEERFRQGKGPLLRNIHREGKPL